MNTLISVIIPVYGVEQYLDQCVESIVNQTYPHLEIILVDDGSPDGCPAMCDAWAKKDARIKVIHQQNGGLSCARNTGIQHATGDYITFVDSDDWLGETCYQTVTDLLQTKGYDLVVFNCNRVNEKGEILSSTEKLEQAGELTGPQALKALVQGKLNHYAVNKVYKRELFSQVRFPLGRAWEDMATAYKIFLQCHSVYYCSEPFYYYLTRSNSISKTITDKALGDIFMARYEIHNAMKTHHPRLVEDTLPMALLSARRLYDRSLWGNVDAERLAMAKEFLAENKDFGLQTKEKTYWLFYTHPRWYAIMRKLRHTLGLVVKRITH